MTLMTPEETRQRATAILDALADTMGDALFIETAESLGDMVQNTVLFEDKKTHPNQPPRQLHGPTLVQVCNQYLTE